MFSCEYHEMFESSFFMEHFLWLLLKMVEEFLGNSNSTLERFCTEYFLKEKDLQRRFIVIEDIK